VLKKIANV